jgi:hypothetical protein
VCSNTANLQLPHAQRTVVVADILLEMAGTKRAHLCDPELLQLLAQESLRSIFSNYEQVYKGTLTKIDHLLHCGQPYFEICRELQPKYDAAVYKLKVTFQKVEGCCEK